jgi:preprotein translocase subunit YajC
MMILTVLTASASWAGITAANSPAPLLAQAAGGGLIAFLPLVLIMVIFYVLLILPAQKRQKKTAQMQQALKNGDRVLTSGGIYGTIAGLEETAVMIRVAEQVKLRVARSAITEILEADAKEIQ